MHIDHILLDRRQREKSTQNGIVQAVHILAPCECVCLNSLFVIVNGMPSMGWCRFCADECGHRQTDVAPPPPPVQHLAVSLSLFCLEQVVVRL